jgi:hypothetical protein
LLDAELETRVHQPADARSSSHLPHGVNETAVLVFEPAMSAVGPGRLVPWPPMTVVAGYAGT